MCFADWQRYPSSCFDCESTRQRFPQTARCRERRRLRGVAALRSSREVWKLPGSKRTNGKRRQWRRNFCAALYYRCSLALTAAAFFAFSHATRRSPRHSHEREFLRILLSLYGPRAPRSSCGCESKPCAKGSARKQKRDHTRALSARFPQSVCFCVTAYATRSHFHRRSLSPPTPTATATPVLQRLPPAASRGRRRTASPPPRRRQWPRGRAVRDHRSSASAAHAAGPLAGAARPVLPVAASLRAAQRRPGSREHTVVPPAHFDRRRRGRLCVVRCW